MGFFKNQDLWLSRGGFTAVLVGAFILLKVMVDNNPSMFPSYITDFAISKQPQPQPQNCLECANNPNLIGESGPLLDPIVMANSFLPCKDYVKPGISTFELLNISHYFKTALEDSELLHAAQDAATRPLAPGKPRIAFLFIIRQEIPYLPVWERFFDGVDTDTYSIYTHPSWWANDFPNTSVFHNRAISFKDVHRYSITLVDVVRRLLAFALLDHEKPNLWFALASEACVPARSFPFMYDYFMNSRTSFVEAFSPMPWYRRWETLPHFRKEQLRKGELWNSVHRRHAGMIVGDVTFYRKFKADCIAACTLDEEYVQTLLFVKDPEGIAKRTVTYVDWSNPDHRSSPEKFTSHNITSQLIQKIQNRTENYDGQYVDSSDDTNRTLQSCVYNGQPHSPCFLFARKFGGEKEDVDAFLAIPKAVLGY